jgi:hypothetical protein
MRRLGDRKTGRLGDGATRRMGQKATLLSPVAQSLSRSRLKIRIEGLKKIWKKRYEEKLKLS